MKDASLRIRVQTSGPGVCNEMPCLDFSKRQISIEDFCFSSLLSMFAHWAIRRSFLSPFVETFSRSGLTALSIGWCNQRVSHKFTPSNKCKMNGIVIPKTMQFQPRHTIYRSRTFYQKAIIWSGNKSTEQNKQAGICLSGLSSKKRRPGLRSFHAFRCHPEFAGDNSPKLLILCNF